MSNTIYKLLLYKHIIHYLEYIEQVFRNQPMEDLRRFYCILKNNKSARKWANIYSGLKITKLNITVRKENSERLTAVNIA